MEEQLKSAPSELTLRLWAMEHFRVLPTDPRLTDLTNDQLEVLFTFSLTSAGDEQMKTRYARLKEEEQVVEDLPREQLRKMGYGKEEIERISQDLRQVRG